MSLFRLHEDESLPGAQSWFEQFGGTDVDYMSAHWNSFHATRDFVFEAAPDTGELTILDIGAHWLHNAFLYANRGHRLICMDAYDLMQRPHIHATAAAMGAELRPTRRLETADGVADLPENTVDIVLFCEIIEHLSFNPIPFWKEIYLILKPGGRIIVTTPNAFYFRNLTERLQRIVSGKSFGLSLLEIFQTGTYGHHWKEFSLSELQEYFLTLSPDFNPTRFRLVYHPFDKEIKSFGLIESIIADKIDILAYSIYMDIKLENKNSGISIDPPWIPV